MDFLHPDNVAGQNLLKLVARGNAIVAELLRLSANIPSVYLGSPDDPIEAKKYSNIVFDFKYLKKPEMFDAKIDSEPELQDLDEEFRETNYDLLERFYKLFESIYRYIQDWTTYLEELIDGIFVQHTVEGVLMDVEGKQLMVEALYLYGVMLLLLDMRIPGTTREMMIVSYIRYKGQGAVPNIDHVVKLCRSTGWAPGKRPKNYPEEYFSRFKLPEEVISMVVARLRADDIYNHVSAYPSPSHRSTALSSQSAVLYVILYFAPDTLHKQTAIMREIVDKHFCDNWVIAFFMGFLVDLSEWWLPYKAASSALANIITKQNVTDIIKSHTVAIPKLVEGLDKYLTEGVLLDEYVLDHVRKLLHHVRNCNVALRWLLLHRTTVNKKYRDQVHAAVSADQLVHLMMHTAQYEFKLKTIVKKLLESKEQRWVECRNEAAGRMIELHEYFSGEKALTRVKKNQNLQNWFKGLADEIQGLNSEQPVLAGRKIAQLISALEDVAEFHQIEGSVQVTQFLADTRSYLHKMIRTVNVTQQVMGDLDIVSDFSYAWQLITQYTALLHDKIRSNPSIVLLLRSTFLKMACILDKPLLRITQCDSPDAVSVAEYYSSSLVNYVRKVLEVIPQSVFKVLDNIITITTNTLRPLPTKLERKHLKDLSQLEERYQLSRHTHQVSVFTEGVLAMHTTFLGIIKLDPHQLLEDGIRKELVRQITTALHEFLVFKSPPSLADFEARLTKLGQKLDGFRQSFEYIQDYVGVYGLKVWQQEFSRIINYSVEQECNEFLKKKIYDWQSQYQSEAIPIPTFPRLKVAPESVNFTGRLVRELLVQTQPLKTTYIDAMQGWYDEKDVEVVGIRTFSLIHKGLGMFGLVGIDKLVCFMIVRDLSKFVTLYRKTVTKSVQQFIVKLTGELHPTSQFPANTAKLYGLALQRTAKLWPNFLDLLTKIGQAQLIRRQIAKEINFSCKLDSKILCSALETMNHALITDVKKHYSDQKQNPYPGTPILPNLCKYLENAGISNPITKIYITTEPLSGIPVLMFLFVLSEVKNFQWNSKLCTLTSKGKKGPDGAPFIMGVITLLKQFHSSHIHTFLAYLGQYVRSTISSTGGEKAAVIPPDVISVLLFLQEFCRFSYTSRKAIEALVPSYLFDRFTYT